MELLTINYFASLLPVFVAILMKGVQLSKTIDRKYLKNLRTVGIIEAISTIVLFGVAMPLKYFADLPIAVSIVGPIHGILFMVLIYMLFTGIKRIPITKTLAATGMIGAIFPFGPFVVDRWLGKIGK